MWYCIKASGSFASEQCLIAVKTVNVLHVIKGKNNAALPGKYTQVPVTAKSCHWSSQPAGQFIPGAFRGRLLTWPRAFESGIYCRALRAVFFIPAFVIVVTPGKPANHTHRECWVFKQSGKLNAVHKGEDTPSEALRAVFFIPAFVIAVAP